MLEKGRNRKVGLGLVAAAALCLSTWTGAEARPFGLLLGGGFHPHLGGLGVGFHHPGGLAGGFRPGGFGGGFHGGPVGFRQAGLGYRGYGSRRWDGGAGRGGYWGAYGAAAAVGAIGSYSGSSGGYTSTESDDSDYRAYRYYGYPAYGY